MLEVSDADCAGNGKMDGQKPGSPAAVPRELS